MKLWILGKTSLIALTIFTFTLYILSIYFDFRIYDILRLRRTKEDDHRVRNTTKKILFWNTMFGNKHFYMGKGDIFGKCPVSDCYATHDRDFANLLDFDAILFHGNELDVLDLPVNRSRRQWYIFVNLESPVNRPLVSHVYEDFFNLTMTYRLDSDIPWTYGIVRSNLTGEIVAPRKNVSWIPFYNWTDDPGKDLPDRADLSRTIEGKRRPIVWFVSNCIAKSGRQKYVDQLSVHIEIDVYGTCGSNQCSRNANCFAEVAEPGYFFYLSFENSLCDDYVTEKLYNALRYNIVPIVYGGANYSKFAPPKSHINVFDFDTPKALADYLKRLMNHPDEYKEYLSWKKYYKIDAGLSSTVCDLCEFLHKRKSPRTYESLSDWYSRGKCPLQDLLRHHGYVSKSAFGQKDRIDRFLPI